MKKGFTLVELLIVIAILALLMSVIVITLNPAEMLRKSRDTKRVADLNALRTAINLAITDGITSIGTTNNCYFSIPSAGGCPTAGCSGTKVCATTPTLVDGTGWIPINFGSISSGSPLAALPVDPTNSTASKLYYSYAADATNLVYELNAKFESNSFQTYAINDGGNANTTPDALYEIGSAPGLTLLPSPTAGFYK